ncbi:MAG TPA: CpsD/CapB family tyrosine-protein kinase [Chthoniobacterales bacterium]|nr:CpsD/CapB family tyrosine-protein kinase [Chthoniobacterales bacterium]
MDRIRKALDLARQERDRAFYPDVRAVTIDPEAKAHLTSEPSRSAPGLPAHIVYTHTRVFGPDAAALESKRIVDPAGNGAAVAAFRMLRTQVIQRMDENGWRTMAVLSPGANDGKTTTAINLAVSLANDHRHTVLLVDCDLRQPSVGGTLGINPEFGVDDLLQGNARIEQCLYHPEGFDRLVVLPARAPLAGSSEALAGPHGRALVADLRDRYPERIVVFDLPPVLGADDALAFLPLVECALVVIAERVTPRDDLLRCMELLRKTPILGTVLNKATDVSSGYG